MFDIGWTEMALVGGAALVLMGPKDMPRALYALGKIIRKFKTFSAGVQKTIDEIMREAEVESLARDINREIGGAGVDFEAERQLALENRKKAAAETPPEETRDV